MFSKFFDRLNARLGAGIKRRAARAEEAAARVKAKSQEAHARLEAFKRSKAG